MGRLHRLSGGEIGIRTRDTLLAYTRFPGVPLKPLEHLSLFGTANIGIFHNYFQKNVYICRINHKLEDYEKGIVCTDSRRRHLRDVKLRQRVRLHGEGKRSGHFQGCNDTRGRRKLLGLQQLQEPLRHLRRSLVHPAALLVYSFGNQ